MLDKLINAMFVSQIEIDGVTKNFMKSLEFMISPDCNLKCSYCYLHKHGKYLYPHEFRDHKLIIDNLTKLVRAIQHHNIMLKELRIFSGEIWDTDFGVNVLRTILQLNKETPFILETFTIPTNCQFVIDDYKRERIQTIIDEFSDNGIRLVFSGSIDGIMLDDKFRRHKNDITIKEHEYDMIFSFLAKNKFHIHPMVSPDSVKYWIDNYDWLIKKCNQFDITQNIMMLEVRDGNWTDENIAYYVKFLEHVFNYRLNVLYHGDFVSFCRDGIRCLSNKCINPNASSYNNIGLYTFDNMGCTVQKTIMVRIGDLSIVPCHRLSYDRFLFGYVKIDDKHNIEIVDKNVEMAIKTWSVHPKVGLYKCDQCKYKTFCMGPCLGANFEFSNDPFFTLDEKTCNMHKAHVRKLAQMYLDHGIADLIYEDKIRISNRREEMEFLRDLQNVLGGDMDE